MTQSNSKSNMDTGMLTPINNNSFSFFVYVFYGRQLLFGVNSH